MVRESYKWVLCPMQFSATEKSIDWEAVAVSSNAANLIQEIENRLREEEWITSEWSPIHLKALLDKWYFKNGTVDVSGLKVYQDTCHYLYLPRLVNDQVFKNAISSGLTSEDYFGFAAGKDGDRYLGFAFGNGHMSVLDDASLLIERESAADYHERTTPAPHPSPVFPAGGGDPLIPTPEPNSGGQPQPEPQTTSTIVKNQFYGNINLDPVTAKIDFATIVDEVVQQFTTKLGVNVSISVEIQAKSKDGFDEGLQRSIKENCNTLSFRNSEFDREE